MEQCHLMWAAGLEIIMYSFSLPEKIALRLGHWIMLNGLINFRDIWGELFSLLLSNMCLRNLLIHVHTVSPWTDVTFHKINLWWIRNSFKKPTLWAGTKHRAQRKERRVWWGKNCPLQTRSQFWPLLLNVSANLLPAHSSPSGGWSLSHRLCLLTF